VVDVGAGTGLLTLAFAKRVERVWAFDISPAMVEYLRAKAASAGFENVDAIVASALSLPLVEVAAELVVSNYCFHHLSDRDKRRALSEVHRVLVPGGRVVIGDMMFPPGVDRRPRSAGGRAERATSDRERARGDRAPRQVRSPLRHRSVGAARSARLVGGRAGGGGLRRRRRGTASP